jgi:hypothetical protein
VTILFLKHGELEYILYPSISRSHAIIILFYSMSDTQIRRITIKLLYKINAVLGTDWRHVSPCQLFLLSRSEEGEKLTKRRSP